MIEITPISRTVGETSLVDEMLIRFTHSRVIDYLLLGIAPTGRRVEIPAVVVAQFRDGKLAREHIYWDQASVLVQIGKLQPEGLPIAGVEVARKVLDPSLPSNRLITELGERALVLEENGGPAIRAAPPCVGWTCRFSWPYGHWRVHVDGS